jgi:hypothetical protein
VDYDRQQPMITMTSRRKIIVNVNNSRLLNIKQENRLSQRIFEIRDSTRFDSIFRVRIVVPFDSSAIECTLHSIRFEVYSTRLVFDSRCIRLDSTRIRFHKR